MSCICSSRLQHPLDRPRFGEGSAQTDLPNLQKESGSDPVHGGMTEGSRSLLSVQHMRTGRQADVGCCHVLEGAYDSGNDGG